MAIHASGASCPAAWVDAVLTEDASAFIGNEFRSVKTLDTDPRHFKFFGGRSRQLKDKDDQR